MASTKKRQPIDVHPVGRSVMFFLLLLLGAVSIAIGLVAFVAPSAGAGPNLSALLGTASDIGLSLLNDASWMLPALLTVVLSMIAVLFAQSLTVTDARIITSTRTAVTIAGASVAAVTCVLVAFVILSAVMSPEFAPKTVAIVVVALAITLLALWASSIVFGDDEAQASVAREIVRSNASLRARIEAVPVAVGTALANLGAIFILIGLAHISIVTLLATTSGTVEPQTANDRAINFLLLLVTYIVCALLSAVSIADDSRTTRVALQSLHIIFLLFIPLSRADSVLRDNLASGAAFALGILLIGLTTGLRCWRRKKWFAWLSAKESVASLVDTYLASRVASAEHFLAEYHARTTVMQLPSSMRGS